METARDTGDELEQDTVRELSIANAEKMQLQDQVQALENQITLKEGEMESVEQQQLQAVPAVAQEEASTSLGMHGGGDHQTSVHSNIRQLESQFSEEVGRMRAWLGDHRLLSPDGKEVRRALTCNDLTPEQVEELRELGQQCHGSCARCFSLSADVDVPQLLRISLKSNQAQISDSASDWRELVESISLSDKVRDDALQLRQRCMGRLEEVFHSRQAVNLEAVKVLLPQVEGCLSSCNDEDWRSTPTFFKQHEHACDTAHVLRKLRDVLAQEQQALADVTHSVYLQLLDPLQLSRWIVASCPHHCDVVPLLNAIHACYEGSK